MAQPDFASSFDGCALFQSLPALLHVAHLLPHLLPLTSLQVWNTAFQVVAARQRSGAEAADFSFRAFMDGPVARVRRKPARARCVSES